MKYFIYNYFRRTLNTKQRRLLRKLFVDFTYPVFRYNLNTLAQLCGTDKYGNHSYTPLYNDHFNSIKNRKVNLLEIGIGGYDNPYYGGNSLRMWKRYFHRGKIYGIDINPNCKEAEEENIKIFIGSQTDKKFLTKVKQNIPPIDVLIDDGGHTMLQQITFFEELFGAVKNGGVYLCEDLHTSYWLRYGGGYKRKNSYIEYSKNFIDHLNAFHSEQKKFRVNKFTQTVNSLHYYDSVLVVEKAKRDRPYVETTGEITVSDSVLQEGSYTKQTLSKIKYIRNYYRGYLIKHIFLSLISRLLNLRGGK